MAMSDSDEKKRTTLGECNLKSLPEIFTFPSVDLTERYEDLREILNEGDEERGVLAREVKTRWTSYLETYVEKPSWLAVWASGTPQSPVNKVVDVADINFLDLEASVEPLDDDDLIEDNEIVVPLVELYPIKNQSKDFNIFTTATCLDQLRFFYSYIWKPWDVNDEESEDWTEEHLENRINLLTLDPQDPVIIKLKRLASESAYNQSLLKQLDDTLSSQAGDNKRDEESDEVIVEKSELFLREEIIRKDVEILENSTLRLAKRRVEQKRKREKYPEGGRISLVGPNNFAEIKSMFEAVQADCGLNEGSPLGFYGTLQEALNDFIAGDAIILSPGEHFLSCIEDFREGGTMIGIGDAVITPDEFHSSIMMDFAPFSKIAIKNVTLQTSDNFHETLFVSKDTSLELTDVRIIGGLVGICSAGGRVSVNGSNISHCKIGIRMSEGCASLKMYATEIRNCQKGLLLNGRVSSKTLIMNNVNISSNNNDIYVYCSEKTDSIISGDHSLLENVSQLSDTSSCNTLGNVTINPQKLYE